MKNQSDILRLLRNLIRIGTVNAVDLERGLCRVDTGGNLTDWLHWMTCRAGRARMWWAPSEGEQVLVLALGGELDTAFVLPGIFSDNFPAPSASADALHITFPDGAVMEYEPASGALSVTGIKTANVQTSESITASTKMLMVKADKIILDAPEVVCTNKLSTGTLEVKGGGKMTGSIQHTGGEFSSNGIVLDKHTHGGVQNGSGNTDKPA
ncbi:phage baseplate assembly protein V [Serratia proteamaculans]|uniref:phage baseplate assembly protein V n=1 Tax=Serratia proteamaculans TaxID=28151 RepID=UPI00217885DF|nr:phage baseplate assembly protein V [Serratia proteamaculans]CAI0887419.1 Phage P2 baseplate assembly protein gpV [Serratia proteamaculans]CAI1056256.1 Phage P2 baseplate assembly protein gpV [Serratia proteamaculans]